MAAPYWAESPASWNSVILGDVFLPGFCQVQVSRAARIDVQNPKGADGAYVVDEGMDPASIDIDVQLISADDFEIWQQIFPKLTAKTAGKSREPLGIQHPECTVFGVRSVYIQSISGDFPSARGGKKYSIKCIEYLAKPVKPKKKGGIGSEPKPTGKKGPFVSPDKSPANTFRGRQLDQAYDPKGVSAQDFMFQGT